MKLRITFKDDEYVVSVCNGTLDALKEVYFYNKDAWIEYIKDDTKNRGKTTIFVGPEELDSDGRTMNLVALKEYCECDLEAIAKDPDKKCAVILAELLADGICRAFVQWFKDDADKIKRLERKEILENGNKEPLKVNLALGTDCHGINCWVSSKTKDITAKLLLDELINKFGSSTVEKLLSDGFSAPKESLLSLTVRTIDITPSVLGFGYEKEEAADLTLEGLMKCTEQVVSMFLEERE